MASLRKSVTGTTWTQVGNSPATVQNLSDQVPVMVACEASAPTAGTQDGLVLVNQGDEHYFQLAATAIWAAPVNSALTAVVAVQPE